MGNLKAISNLDEVITFHKDMLAAAPGPVKPRFREFVTFYEVLKQFRAGEQPTQQVNRKKLDARVGELTKEIKEFLCGYIREDLALDGEGFWSEYAPLGRMEQLELLRDLQSYLDYGKSFEWVMLRRLDNKK